MKKIAIIITLFFVVSHTVNSPQTISKPEVVSSLDDLRKGNKSCQIIHNGEMSVLVQIDGRIKKVMRYDVNR